MDRDAKKMVLPSSYFYSTSIFKYSQETGKKTL